jgi:hypothetical protein
MNVCLNRFPMHKIPRVIQIDMRKADWRSHLPPEMASAIGRVAGDQAHEDKLFVVLRDPTPRQAFGHLRLSVVLFVRSLAGAIGTYFKRIDRGYIAKNYVYHDTLMEVTQTITNPDLKD